MLNFFKCLVSEIFFSKIDFLLKKSNQFRYYFSWDRGIHSKIMFISPSDQWKLVCEMLSQIRSLVKYGAVVVTGMIFIHFHSNLYSRSQVIVSFKWFSICVPGCQTFESQLSEVKRFGTWKIWNQIRSESVDKWLKVDEDFKPRKFNEKFLISSK